MKNYQIKKHLIFKSFYRPKTEFKFNTFKISTIVVQQEAHNSFNIKEPIVVSNFDWLYLKIYFEF